MQIIYTISGYYNLHSIYLLDQNETYYAKTQEQKDYKIYRIQFIYKLKNSIKNNNEVEMQ